MLEGKFIRLDGANIHYIEAGKGFPVMLFHGASFNCRTYEETGTIETIANSGFHAMSIDFPGFGKSESIGIPLHEFIKRLMDLMDIDKVVMLGASMGGEAVVGFAVKYPGRVKALMLAGAVGVSEYKDELRNMSGKPMLLMWGKNDPISPASNYQLLMKCNESAEFYSVGERHACYLDDSRGFNKHISEFLSKLIK